MDTPPTTVGRPALPAVRDPLIRQLSDLMYQVGADLMTASRAVERRQVDHYVAQATAIGAAVQQIILLHGQLASLDEIEGGKMHGTQRPTFPEQDPVLAERLEQFRARREPLAETQRRPLPLRDEDDFPDPPLAPGD
jgi:hypothetical protein